MQYIKGNFSFRLKSKLDVWERGFNEHRIVGSGDYENHRIYIEENPVGRALATTAVGYPYSSAGRTDRTDPTPGHLIR